MSEFLTSDNVKLYFEVNGEGRAIVFIHSYSMDHRNFLYQARNLSKKYKTVLYDHRGHGSSERTDKGLTMQRLATDLRELIDYLKLDNVVLVGWSMGASTIFEYIRNFGTEKLAGVILFDITPKMLNDDQWKLGVMRGKYEVQDLLDDLTMISNNWLDYGEKFIKLITPYLQGKELEYSLKESAKNTPHVMLSLWLALNYNDYRDVLEKITVPAIIAYGENSLISSETFKYMQSKIHNSKVIPFENCTHALVLENPKKALQIIEEFMEGSKCYL